MEGYIFDCSRTNQVEDYVFVVNSHHPERATQSAKEMLREVIRPQIVRDLAKMKPNPTLPFPHRRHAETAGRR